MHVRSSSILPCAALALLTWLAAGCANQPASVPTAPAPLPPLSKVTVSPATDTLVAGQSAVFTATALDTLGAVVGYATFVWTSTNPAAFAVDGHGNVQALAEGSGLVVASAGGFSDSATVAVIVQRGWYMQTSQTSNDLNGVFFLPDRTHGWAVGSAGRIVATTNAGASWSQQVSNSGFNLNAVWFTGPDSGWVVGAAGAVLRTVNGGMTWTQVTSNAGENLLDVWFATRDTGWVVGANGVVLRTFDRGATWQRKTPTSFDLQSVSFAGTRDGWAVGNGGVILGTHDRGISWYIVQPSITAQALNAVWRSATPAPWAVGDGTAWAAGQSGATPRAVATADSLMWELDNAGASNNLLGVCYPSDRIGYAVGYNSGGVGLVLRTDDGGVTWQTQSPNTQFRLKDVFFTDPLNGWAVGRNGTILHTSSGGLP
ncbi:MAG: Ig-like domain-containing protein [Candidatus Eisenbacteria bacterium]|nr:Ig-like domain-containing protein [Candidatus Eisenbacteria bacterium]